MDNETTELTDICPSCGRCRECGQPRSVDPYPSPFWTSPWWGIYPPNWPTGEWWGGYPPGTVLCTDTVTG